MKADIKVKERNTMIINHNLGAMNALSALNSNSSALNSALEKLSSGKKINSAADNASGYAISQKMQGQINGLDQASQNAQDGISLIQTASGALNETTSLLQNMRQLATQASNSTTTASDRADLQTQFNQLADQINNIGNSTQFNTQNLLNGGSSQNSGSVITEATASSIAMDGAATAGNIGNAQLVVNNQTFDLTGKTLVDTTSTNPATGSTYTQAEANAANIATLGAVTSGSTKLSDMVNITADSSGVLTFTTKGTGDTSSLEFTGTDVTAGTAPIAGVSGTAATPGTASTLADAALGATAVNVTTANLTAITGTDSTMQQSGLQATTALSAGDISIANNASFNIAIGTSTSAPVTVNLNTTGQALNFATNSGSNLDAQNSAMNDVVNTVNAALQKAGLSGQVQASLGTNDQLQFLSNTGQNIYLTDGSGTPLTAVGNGLGFATSDLSNNGNVQEVVGSGAQGSGYTASFQIGANSGQTMSLTIGDMRANALGITGNAGQQGYSASNDVTNGTDNLNSSAALDITSTGNADKAISVIDNAIQTVTTQQANLGAVQNRLQSTINNLGTSSQNLTTAQSGITDVDMASEMSKFTQANVLQQAAVSMLAQANQQPQLVLKLLG
jgi:flagellin